MEPFDLSRYSGSIRDHARNPRNVGSLPDADGTAFREHPACGDRLTISVRLGAKQAGAGGSSPVRLIEEIRFTAQACAGTLAAASIATEMARGLEAREVLERIGTDEIDQALGGFPPGKGHCPSLVAEVLHAAIRAGLEPTPQTTGES